MNYIKTNWKNDDIITAEKMNKIENAISEAFSNSELFFLNFNYGNQTTDKTYEEFEEAIQKNKAYQREIAFDETTSALIEENINTIIKWGFDENDDLYFANDFGTETSNGYLQNVPR